MNITVNILFSKQVRYQHYTLYCTQVILLIVVLAMSSVAKEDLAVFPIFDSNCEGYTELISSENMVYKFQSNSEYKVYHLIGWSPLI